MRTTRRHRTEHTDHTDRRWHRTPPSTERLTRTGRTTQPPADRLADAIGLVWGLR
jgi:hypothetical protein